MCLCVDGSRRVAREDIVCYKVLGEILDDDGNLKRLISPYYVHYEWVIGKEVKAKRSYPRIKGTIKDGYFHVFCNKANAEEEVFWHSTGSKVRFCVYKCIIPKGSSYYYGFQSCGGEGYASKRLIIVEKEH